MKGTTVIATFLGTGLMRPAPGTWGSLAALPVAWALMTLLGPLWLIPAAVLAFLLGWWATAIETRGQDDHDPSEIVIDEVAGQWIALFPVAIGVAHTGAALRDLWPGWIAAFVLFRLFDIWKPWLVGRADRRGDALGVMLDDVWAGVFAAIGVAALAAFAHGVLM
ncbi:phosphatidylglycerophosphatase A [Albidovulum sediminicola]|uniref:Phosphatidylglycerophosphatase A n=1 Tax=Albidovulum sediminicola TaxID=2984331 RepID=A0ABT2Z3M3_9RHOB|nr:phosphatidylglycerophosphatase A [Defluviimonas sp. WL0075]MCV2865713.1 phosphatidylglycerophosphatase A [Defluviimonas sp. WL0075]